MTCVASEHESPNIEEQILELWFDGFDTIEIAEGLSAMGAPVTEAHAANVIAREMDRRHVAHQHGGACA